MRRFESEWERELAASPFDKSFFTPKHLNKIEEQIKSGKPKPSRSWLSITCVSAAAAAIVLLLLIQPPKVQSMLEQVSSWFWEETLDTLELITEDVVDPREQQPPQDIVQEQQQSVQFIASIYAFSEPGYWGFSKDEFRVEAGESYALLEEIGEFVKIQNGDRAGWVPSWYVLKQEHGEVIQELEPYEMIVEKETALHSYPEEGSPSLYYLEQGKVVRVQRQYGDWLGVELFTYGEPVIGEKWIDKDDLREYEDQYAMEGYLRLSGGGSFIYTESDAKDVQEFVDYKMTVMINEEYDDTYLITAAGGLDGYIKKTDFVPNPFGHIRGTYLELSGNEEEALIRFVGSRDDEELKELEPMQVFKIYLNAELMNDAGLQYDLLYKQDGMPTREQYIQEAEEHAQLNRSNQLKFIARVEAVEIEEVYEDNNVYIKPVNGDADSWAFRMQRTDEGIWKVGWLALQ